MENMHTDVRVERVKKCIGEVWRIICTLMLGCKGLMRIDYEDYNYLFRALFTIIPPEQKLIILSLGHKLLPRVNS